MIDVLQVFAWPKIKPAVRVKLESIIEDFNLAMPEDQVGLLQQVDYANFECLRFLECRMLMHSILPR